jgi:hypothetical protein
LTDPVGYDAAIDFFSNNEDLRVARWLSALTYGRETQVVPV